MSLPQRQWSEKPQNFFFVTTTEVKKFTSCLIKEWIWTGDRFRHSVSLPSPCEIARSSKSLFSWDSPGMNRMSKWAQWAWISFVAVEHFVPSVTFKDFYFIRLCKDNLRHTSFMFTQRQFIIENEALGVAIGNLLDVIFDIWILICHNTTRPMWFCMGWKQSIKRRKYARRWRDDAQKNICLSQKQTAQINSSSKNSV